VNLRRRDPGDSSALVAARPSELLRAAGDVSSPVLRVILERVHAGSRPGRRDDDHLVCLAVEGGGMRGAVSAGMCVLLEAAGAVPAFDRVYGVSAGALNACATALGQAALSATHYEDAARGGVINRMRPLVGRPLIDFDLLFDDVIAARKPLWAGGRSQPPEFRALATSLETYEQRVLEGFVDVDEMLQGIRASASLPRLGGVAPVFRGERMADGALIEPVPYETPLAEGATHVLVLRSRTPGYRNWALGEVGESLAMRDEPGLNALLKAGHGNYNRQAAALAAAMAGGVGAAQLHQVAVPDGARLVGRLAANAPRVTEALRAGAKAMASVLLDASIDLCWQPVVYRSAPAAERRRRAAWPAGRLTVPAVAARGQARA
jgi:predicted patatin/cPLA2 family phospholipase